MVKFVRCVFEMEIEDNASNEEICESIEDNIAGFLQNRWGIDDLEIHDRPYIAGE